MKTTTFHGVSDSDTMDDSIWRNLPSSLLIAEVLSRLPLKTLCRFRCVSPSWNSLISSPNFSKTHLHITNTTTYPQKTLVISSSRNLYSVNFANPNPTAENLNFPSIEHSEKWVNTWGSCNGLVIVSDGFEKCNFFLLNPFTGECKKLPKFPFPDGSWCHGYAGRIHGLGYDSSADDYKAVKLLTSRIVYSVKFGGEAVLTHVFVYSVKTDAWRRIHDSDYDAVVENDLGAYLNERLHWFCQRLGGSKYVVAFDLSNEIFREVPLPASLDNFRFDNHYVTVLGGCLCLILWYYYGSETEVWMMKKYGVRESWTKFTIANHGMLIANVFYSSVEEEFVLKMDGMIDYDNNEEMIVDEFDEDKLIVYNTKNENLRNMVVCGIPTKYRMLDSYVETLVSPNHGGRIRKQCEASTGESPERYQKLSCLKETGSSS